MIDFDKPSKGLWFPTGITKLCINVSAEVAMNEEKVRARSAISAKASIKAP